MKIRLFCVGQTKTPEIRALCAEYEKRLRAFCDFQVHFIRPHTLSAKPSDAEIRAGLEAEADEILRLLDRVPPRSCVALCVEGSEFSSEELSVMIGARMQTAPEITFLIGSSFGLSERVKERCGLRLSLSRMTLPHELCRLVFSEQLYRAFAILHQSAYHKTL